MNPRTLKAMEATAYHEAGHAVADWRLGFRVKTVSIVPSDGCGGFVISRAWLRNPGDALPFGAAAGRCHARIVCAMAGPEAQRLYDARSVRSWHARSDIETVIEILGRLHEANEIKHVFRYLKQRAGNLVCHPHNWRMIQDLTAALMERRELSGKEVIAILRASLERQRKT